MAYTLVKKGYHGGPNEGYHGVPSEGYHGVTNAANTIHKTYT